MKLIVETLWIIFMSFSMIIHNVTILPTLSDSVRPWFAIATMGIGVCFVILTLINQDYRN